LIICLRYSCAGGHPSRWQVGGSTGPAAVGRGTAVSWYWDGRWRDDVPHQTQHNNSDQTDADVHDVLGQPARCTYPGNNDD